MMDTFVPTNDFGYYPSRRYTLSSVAALLRELARSPDAEPTRRPATLLDESGTFQIDWTIFDTKSRDDNTEICDDVDSDNDNDSDDSDSCSVGAVSDGDRISTDRSFEADADYWSHEDKDVSDLSEEVFQSPHIALSTLREDNDHFSVDISSPDDSTEIFEFPEAAFKDLHYDSEDDVEFYMRPSFRPRSRPVRSVPCGAAGGFSRCGRFGNTRARRRSIRNVPHRTSLMLSEDQVIPEEELFVNPTDRCYGGSCVETGAPSCTHLVVEERSIKTIPFETQSKLHLVKSEWFWGSIQMDACADESIYKFDEISDILQDGHNTPRSISASKSRKRKRLLQDNLRELASDGDIDSPFRTPRQGGSGGVPPANKRRSNELARMSFSASFLDATADTSAVIDKDDAKSPMPDMSKMNPRQYTALELLQTETNYVSILSTIINTIQAGIEEHDQPGGPLLPPTDVKLIFGKVPAIYEVHKKIRNELSDKCQHWQEESCIGDVFVKHADELMKAYPPYINFVSQTQETIAQCDKTKPRFHAFLKVCLTKPECGRQSLAELLIRPVQRLPSICLLLKDILRRTDKAHADHKILQHAKETLDDITSYINEDKRITEGHQALFDIINDIDNCPPNLLSSHRTLITKVDCLELSQTLTQSREPMTLFVFSDSIEMVRRRGKLNSKSPATKTPQKTYKHLEMIYCKDIRKIADINPTPDCRNIFALIVRELNKKERLYSFVILDDEICKSEFLTSLSKVISTNTCRADYENLLVNLDASALQIDTTDLSNRTLSKAATKFGRRVSRAFSFNKTPRKLKRAMTSMSQAMSPFNRRDSMSYSTTNLAAGASRSTLTPSTTRCASLRETRSSSITPSDRPTLRLTNNNDLFEESPVSSANCSPTMSTNTMEDVSTIPYFQ